MRQSISIQNIDNREVAKVNFYNRKSIRIEIDDSIFEIKITDNILRFHSDLYKVVDGEHISIAKYDGHGLFSLKGTFLMSNHQKYLLAGKFFNSQLHLFDEKNKKVGIHYSSGSVISAQIPLEQKIFIIVMIFRCYSRIV